MHRFHVHLSVDDLAKSIAFYSTLFGATPTVVKPDYAKWMLDDPRINIAISQRDGRNAGLDHLGIQVEADGELRKIADRLKSAGESTRDQEAATCCYAQSNKSWVTDPSGVRWETFFTFSEATKYGEDEDLVATTETQSARCGKTACC